jgi:glycosyltransferase involved in cell wall biosynthesis
LRSDSDRGREVPEDVIMVGPLPPPPGGVANFVSNVREALETDGQYHVTVLRTGQSGERSQPLRQVAGDLRQAVRSLPSLKKWSLVHVHTSSYYSFLRSAPYALWAGRISRSKVVVHIHGGMFREFYQDASLPVKYLVRRTLRSADAVVVTSPSWVSMVREIAGREGGVRAIPNGFDTATFRPGDKEAARRALSIDGRGRVLLTVGYLEKVKGHENLIEAMTLLTPSFNDVRLFILGDGSLREGLATKVKEKGLGDRVFFHYAPMPSAQVARWMVASDLFVLPSLSEGSPTVMFEALGCGRPFVGTRVGGTPDVIVSSDLGRLCPPGDPQALADAIMAALAQDWDAHRIAAQAQRYSWTSIAGQLIHLYDDLVAVER